MCGIVGLISHKSVCSRLLESLKKLEYRGYDSAGITTLYQNKLQRHRAGGKLTNLEKLIKKNSLDGTIGIAHTRWATHGAPGKTNAHPHHSSKVAVVHNGIIENHEALRIKLINEGYTFSSQTDTEVVAHLIDHEYKTKPALEAVQSAIGQLEGAYALAILFTEDAEHLYAARSGSPLAFGIGEKEMAIGSDAIALSLFTSRIIYLEEGDIACISQSDFSIYNHLGHEVVRPEILSDVNAEQISKGGYRHFMEKEIHEQPEAIENTLNRQQHPTLRRYCLPSLGIEASAIKRILIIACGTSYYAGMVGKYWLEDLGGLPVEIEIASEFRYRTPRLEKDTLTIFISQSGETADTLAALRLAKELGNPNIAIVNMAGSSMAREADAVLHTQAGPEIGVASTKAFTTQLAVIAALSLAFGGENGTLSNSQRENYEEQLQQIPRLMREAIARLAHANELYHILSKARDVLYIGRGTSYPLAMEGALKLKEISYIHAEGYAAGEMKHGPIALIDENVPIVVLSPKDRWQEKTLSNLEEARSRGGRILLITDEATTQSWAHKEDVETLAMPDSSEFLAPFIYSIPIQLLAYNTACLKGTDVDQPRNLAKSVTVE